MRLVKIQGDLIEVEKQLQLQIQTNNANENADDLQKIDFNEDVKKEQKIIDKKVLN